MIKFVDNALNRITMYRLVEYVLALLICVAALLCFLGILPYDPYTLLFTTGFLIAACWITNTIFAKAFRVPANVESVYISALILALIITPLTGYHDLIAIGWVAVLAMASKYVVAIKGKHVFNPVALAVALTALTINQTAGWWIGNVPMLPFVVVGGVLIVRKVRHFDVVLTFLAVTLLTSVAFSFAEHGDILMTVRQIFIATPPLFFACVILTEPLTMPPTRTLQILYGALVGFLFSPQIHFGPLYTTPELAILIGNCYSYLVSPKTKLALKIKERIQLGPDQYDFIFMPQQRLSYAPGQYMEWTLGHKDPDSRGNRRYFTLASSPTEATLRLGVTFYPHSSSYKHSMFNLDENSAIIAAQHQGNERLISELADLTYHCLVLMAQVGVSPDDVAAELRRRHAPG